MKNIKKIVITGGPCGGKSTALSRIQDEFTQRGYRVLFISETATELIRGGVAPWTCESSAEFQELLLSLQLEKERVYEKAARGMDADDILIVCDRGALDNKAYITDTEYRVMLERKNISERELADRYDAVFFLVTAAIGSDGYSCMNNSARTETPEQAAELDRRLACAWQGHSYFRMIDNSTDFEGKMKRLVHEISAFLGGGESYEIERKYLIEYPDMDMLRRYQGVRCAHITQTYLNAGCEEERRVRKREIDGECDYTLTIKRAVSDIKRVEIERRITEQDYKRALRDADKTKHSLKKTRYSFEYCGKYLEIDIYPLWQDRAICEIELSCENEPVHFPDWIRVIREVTGDPEYKNASLAMLQGELLI